MLKLHLVIFLIVGIKLCLGKHFETFSSWEKLSTCLTFENKSNGTITAEHATRYYKACWTIRVPANQFIQLKLNNLNLGRLTCAQGGLMIYIIDTQEEYRFCSGDTNKNPVTSLTSVQIYFEISYEDPYWNYQKYSFDLLYEIQDLECAHKDSYHCSKYNCIPKAEVCDGVKDCLNGADEVGCEKGIASIEGVSQSLSTGITGLKSQRSSLGGWYENTARAVTALFLAGGAKFDGKDKEEELMAKQTELKTAIALLRNPISNEELSMFIHSLLVTCHDPRHFYGQDLVQQLKQQVENSESFVHPIAYLALCNSNSSWPSDAQTYMTKLLNSDSEYSFIRDIQAFAIMALTCYKNKTSLFRTENFTNLISRYEEVIQHFKQYQLPDGSFGNNHTTSLISQALISSGQELATDWKLNATIKYLMKKLDASKYDFISTYLVLPVLNGKSLTDIAKINCSVNPRKHSQNAVLPDVNEYTGKKIRVQYSLFIGEEKDVIHTISLRVPENFTAFEVMKTAQVEDYKYTFEWKKISDKIYIFTIGKTTNDPESGMFWLLYLKPSNSTDDMQHSTISPDKLILSDDDHLIMWFKKAHI